ncbi:hypothetical protein AAZX31_09G098300 [Glycine max]
MLLIAAVTAAIAAARHPTATKAGEAGRFRVAAVAATKAAAWGGISTQNFARYTDSRKCPHLMRESEGIFGFFFCITWPLKLPPRFVIQTARETLSPLKLRCNLDLRLRRLRPATPTTPSGDDSALGEAATCDCAAPPPPCLR